MNMRSKSELRGTIFRQLDGRVTAPTAFSLHKHGVLELILKKGEVDLSTLSHTFKANEGYLNVALRVLCSQGWLEMDRNADQETITYRTNDASEEAFKHIPLYADV